MKSERAVEGRPIEELLAIRDAEANRQDSRADMILELVAAERGLTVPGV